MPSTQKSILFISDPPSQFNLEAETTLFLMHEALARGYRVWQSTPADLCYTGGKLQSLAHALTLTWRDGRFAITIQGKEYRSLEKYHAIFLRKDPPVDPLYIYHLQLLSLLEQKTILFINRPSGILAANEKLLPLHFPHLCPETAVTCDKAVFGDFLKSHGEIVVKPLNLSGGEGIFRVHVADPNALERFSTQSKQFTEYQILQRYLPEASEGDKRILLWNSKILGAFIRIPKPGDFRGNLHQGASFHATTLGSRDHEIIATLMPELTRLGLIFVGIDVIGDYVTEINCTSPMGIREINSLYNKQVEKECFDDLEQSGLFQ